MKLFLKIVTALVCGASLTAFAATSNVTATITDSDSQTWNNCTWSATLSSPRGAPTIGGSPVSPSLQLVQGSCTSSGALSGTFVDVSSLDQSGATYTFTIQPNAWVSPSIIAGVSVTGASPILSTLLSAGIKAPRFPAGNQSFGYLDVEVNPTPVVGDSYYNTGTVCSDTGGLRQFNLAGWACGGGGGSGTTPAILKAGLMALYVPSSCSGTTYTDISGNSNNGTLATSTAAPTCNANGVSFVAGSHQFISLPAALNSAKTVQIFTIPLTILRGAGTGAALNNELLGSSMSAGLHIFGRIENSPGGPFTDSTAIYAGGYTTAINDTTSLPSLYTWDLSCTLDHIYINDQEASSYFSQATTCNRQTTANLQLGGSAANGSGNFSSVTVSVAAFYSTELTAAQVAANYQAIKSYLQNTVGLSFTFKPNGGSTPTLVCTGDSITNGNGVTTPATQSWCTPTVLSPLTTTAFNIANLGAGFGSINTLLSEGESREDTFFQSNTGFNFNTLFLGTNDGGATALWTPSEVFNLLMAFANRRAAGPTHPKPILVTMLSRTGNTAAGTSFDSYKNTLNGLIRGQSIYPILDFAENATLGADGAYANFADGIHPNTAQNVLMAQSTANLMNYLTGSNVGNPTVLTATGTLTWTQARVVRAVPAANMTITMPACDGPTGQTVTIINTQSTAGSFTVGATAATGQTINGIAAGTNVTVPNGGSLVLSDQLNAAATGGCHWEVL